MLAVPAAALLACCDWSSNSSSGDYSNSGSIGGGYLYRVPVLTDAAASIADNSMITAAGAAPGDGGRQQEEGGGAAAGLAKAKARAEAALRAARLVWTAVVISADYKAFDVSQVLVPLTPCWGFNDRPAFSAAHVASLLNLQLPYVFELRGSSFSVVESFDLLCPPLGLILAVGVSSHPTLSVRLP